MFGFCRPSAMRCLAFPLGLGLVVLLATTLATAADPEPAAKPAASSDAKEHLKASDIPRSSLLIPKGGDAKELLTFIHRVEGLEPEFENEGEALKFLATTRGRIIAAADQVLAARPSPEQEQQAIRAKL